MTEIEDKNVTCFLPHNTVPVSVGCQKCQNVQGCHHIVEKASSWLRHSCAIIKQNSLQLTKSPAFKFFWQPCCICHFQRSGQRTSLLGVQADVSQPQSN